MRKQNFILIFPDQWRGDSLGFLSDKVVETPFLDEIASEATVFSNAYSACPSCIAARACLATGQTPSTCGRIGYQDKVPWEYDETMMKVLRNNGYQTINVGKTHFYPQRAALGFEENYIYDPQRFGDGFESDYHTWLHKESNGRVKETAVEWDNNSGWLYQPWMHDVNLHPTVWTIDKSLEMLERRDPTRPFFLQIGFHRPHPPLDPPTEYFNMYKDKKLPPVPVGDWAESNGIKIDSVSCPRGKLRDDLLDRGRKAYYASITHIDHQIGRLMFHLRGMKDTWIIFSSDHGELLGDHNLFRKTYPFEGSSKIPYIVMPPANTAEYLRNNKCELPVTHMDIMPTVLDIAGIDIPECVEGLSFKPALKGENTNWRPFVHGEHSHMYAGEGWQYIVDGKEKYCWETVSGTEMFFDLVKDPMELHNAVNDEEYASRVKLWRKRMAVELAKRPEDGLSDGENLIPGKALPAVRFLKK